MLQMISEKHIKYVDVHTFGIINQLHIKHNSLDFKS